jgi:ApbE superfamily uncharacterized protein (UPF0280 family)
LVFHLIVISYLISLLKRLNLYLITNPVCTASYDIGPAFTFAAATAAAATAATAATAAAATDVTTITIVVVVCVDVPTE